MSVETANVSRFVEKSKPWLCVFDDKADKDYIERIEKGTTKYNIICFSFGLEQEKDPKQEKEKIKSSIITQFEEHKITGKCVVLLDYQLYDMVNEDDYDMINNVRREAIVSALWEWVDKGEARSCYIFLYTAVMYNSLQMYIYNNDTKLANGFVPDSKDTDKDKSKNKSKFKVFTQGMDIKFRDSTEAIIAKRMNVITRATEPENTKRSELWLPV